jgi:parallel beta-helix repeat protein
MKGIVMRSRFSRRPRLEALESRDVPSAAGAAGHILEVHQGDPSAKYQTIQSAVDAASNGDEIRIFTGTYREAVTVSTPGLTLDAARGASVTIESPGGTAEDGVTVADPHGGTLHGFALAGVTVHGFSGDGVRLVNVSGFSLTGVDARDNGEYGLYPLLSSHGTIASCSASGSNDSGIYVGQSSDVAISANFVQNNVNGIEVENSTDVRAVGNTAIGNTVGILVDLLPAAVVAEPGFTPIESSSHILVEGNIVLSNNRPNTASADDIASAEPPGSGIVVIGGDHITVRGNLVAGNAYGGIVLLSGNDLLALVPGLPGYSQADPDPRNTLVADNVLFNNGFIAAPPGFPAAADLIWTGTGADNRWRDNVFTTSTPDDLP